MSLSVCLLTRNEEQHIARAVLSVGDLADEIVVADTGSRDRTAEIAAELVGRVFQFPWEDDFAAGRNFCLLQAWGDWVLWLNADEAVLPESQAELRQCMSREEVFGYFVRVQQPMDERNFAETADLRLFRRRSDLRFVGRLQPEVPEDVVRAIEAERQVVAPSQIVLRSVAPSQERSEVKLRWTLRLLELELQDRPGQLRYLIEYGGTLLALERAAATPCWQKRLSRWQPCETLQRRSVKVQVLLEYLLSVPPDVSRSSLLRDAAFDLALRWFPASPALLFKCAEHSFQRREVATAKELLLRLLDLGRSGAYDRSRRFDPGLMSDDALINLAACCERLGEQDQAAQCYLQLLSSQHFHAQAAAGLARLGR